MDPLVSVTMITYNHEQFIAQAIDSVVSQITGFSFELIVGEDCSTDNTRALVYEFQKRYPDIIRVITSDENVGAYKNYRRTSSACRGRYVAFCEGDDFWTDRRKLTKQVEFLEKHPQYSACYSHSYVLDMATGKCELTEKRPKEYVYDQRMIFKGNKKETHTCTLVARREYLPANLEWMRNVFAGDDFLKMALTEEKPVCVMKEYMSCYRRHAGGIYSSLQGKQLMWRQRNDLAILCERFGDKYRDLIRFRQDKFRFDFVNVMEMSKADRVRVLLGMLRYPDFVFKNVKEYLKRIIVVVIDRRVF